MGTTGFSDDAVALLTPQPGQVMVMRGVHLEDDGRSSLLDQLPVGVLLVELPDADSSLELLDEEQMRSHGWVRAPAS